MQISFSISCTKKITTLVLCVLFFASHAQQKDSVVVTTQHNNTADSIFAFRTKTPLPKRAALYSALFPGIGQYYNKQYWKLPIVAIGIGTATYFIVDNTKFYRRMKKNYLYRIDTNPYTVDEFPLYQTEDIRTALDGARKNLETTYIGTTVGYALCILDAYISAHLKTFDMNSSISLQTKPLFENQPIGIGITYTLK